MEGGRGELLDGEEAMDPEFQELYNHNMRKSVRILFSLGAMTRMDTAVQNFFSQPFLLQVVRIKPFHVGIIMIVRKVWDAVTDPVIGRMSDSIETPWGRRKPWVILSTLPVGIYWLLQWMVQPFNHAMNFAYFLFVLLNYNSMRTCAIVPYRALIPDVALTYNTRSSVAAWMQGIGQIATVVAVTLFGYIIDKYASDGHFYAACLILPGICLPKMISVMVVMERSSFTSLKDKQKKGDEEEVVEKPGADAGDGETSVETQKSDSEAEKFRENELENEHSNRSARNGSDESDEGDVIEYSLSSRFTSKLEETWKTCVDLKDFLLITAAVFIVSIAAALMQSNFLFALRYVFLIEGSSLSLFLQTGMAIVSLPLWFLYMKRVGKNKAFLTSCVMLAVPLLFLCFLPAGYETVILFLAGFFGFANAAPLIVQAMIPDSVQAYEMYSGRRDEAFLYSISLLAAKMGQAVGLSASSFILGIVGYDPTTQTQTELVKDTIRVLTFGFPAIVIIIGAALIMFTSDFSKLQIVPVAAVSSISAAAVPTPELLEETDDEMASDEMNEKDPEEVAVADKYLVNPKMTF